MKDAKVRTSKEGPTFATNIGVSQRNGLRPILFTLYLEAATKYVKVKVLAQDVAYADDIDFISKDSIDLEIVEKILASWNLQMNIAKNETLSI